jgi:hypothetical protein
MPFGFGDWTLVDREARGCEAVRVEGPDLVA